MAILFIGGAIAGFANEIIWLGVILILVLVWRVAETYKAVFDVDDYQHFVLVQSDAALRKLAGLYPYGCALRR
jgi:hypothetical protein